MKLVASAGVGVDRGRRREGARGRRPRRRRGRRHGREPAALDQARRRAVGARARRDAAGARRERAARPGAGAGRRRLQDRPRRRRRRAARRGRVLVRHRAAARRGLPDGALVPPRHVPGRDREPAARAAREVRGHAGDGRGVPPVRRPRGARAARVARAAHARRRGRPRRSAPPAADGRSRPPTRSTSPRCSCDAGSGHARYVGEPVPHEGDRLGALLHAQGKAAISGARLVEPGYAITNADRADRRAPRRRDREARSARRAPAGRVRARFEGSAGQSFGAFLTAGVELRLVGEANDYVGKSMSGGRIVVAPPAGDAGDPCLRGQHRALRGDRRGALLRRLRRRALRRPQLRRGRGRRGRRRPRAAST